MGAEGIFSTSPASYQQFKAAINECPSTVTLFQNQLENCLTLAYPGASEETLQKRRGVQVKLRQMKESEEKRMATIRQPSRQSSRPSSSQKKIVSVSRTGFPSGGSVSGGSTLGSTLGT